MTALQRLAIAGYCASLRLTLHHHKHTLHPVQLIFLGLLQLNLFEKRDLMALLRGDPPRDMQSDINQMALL
jgi:putative transposase